MNEVSANLKVLAAHPILAIGFSARALAHAVHRSGFPVAAIDHFQDHDLSQLCPTRRISWGSNRQEFMEEVAAAADSLDGSFSDPKYVYVLAAGGFEGQPEAWQQFQVRRRFLGPSISQVTELRSLDFLQRATQAVADESVLSFPESQLPIAKNLGFQKKEDSQWLAKSTVGSGGGHVQDFNEAHSVLPASPDESETPTGITYLQRKIAGRVLGVSFIVHGQEVKLQGCTESWRAADWTAPSEYIYRGSWGPVSLKTSQQKTLIELAQYIAEASGVQGWLQMDLIEDGDGRMWLLELNPRWTAGMEILTSAGVDIVTQHVQCFVRLPPSVHARSGLLGRGSSRRFGKAVFYARDAVSLTEEKRCQLAALPFTADIPSRRVDCVEPGHPVLTLMTSCMDENQEGSQRKILLDSLHKQAAIVQRILS